MKRRGFTLVEVLIVLAVIAALAGIGIPLARSALAKSREASCLNKLRSLGVALESYLQDNSQMLPTLAESRTSKTEDVAALDTVLLPYLETPDAFNCPADSKEYDASGSSYWWNAFVNGQHTSKLFLFGLRPDHIPLIADKQSWHPNGTNFLYPDLSSSNKPRFVAGN